MEAAKCLIHVLIWRLIIATGATEEDNWWTQEHVFAIPFLSVINYPPHVAITTWSSLPIKTFLFIPNNEFEKINIVTKDNPAEVIINTKYDIRIRYNEGKQNKTIIVRSSDKVTVHVIDNILAGGDGFVVAPSNQLGKTYYVASFKPAPSISSNDLPKPSFFCVTSLSKSTLINIRTQAGQEDSIILDKFESYRFDGGDNEDLSGTLVQSNSPITVTSGVFTRIPGGVYNFDGLLEQLPPVSMWGNSFTLIPYASLNAGYLYRVFTMNKSTILTMGDKRSVEIGPGVEGAELFYEENVSGEYTISFTSDQPVMVAQYMKGFEANNPGRGDPSMLIVPPTTSFSHSATFYVFEYSFYLKHKHYINILATCSTFNGLMFDDVMGTWDYKESMDSHMCYASREVSTEHHCVNHTNPIAAFYVSVYAISDGGSSYVYSASAYFSQGPFATAVPPSMATELSTITSPATGESSMTESTPKRSIPPESSPKMVTSHPSPTTRKITQTRIQEETLLTTDSDATNSRPREAVLTTDSDATNSRPREAILITDSDATNSRPREAILITDSDATNSRPREAVLTTDSDATNSRPREAMLTTDSDATNSRPREVMLTTDSDATNSRPREIMTIGGFSEKSVSLQTSIIVSTVAGCIVVSILVICIVFLAISRLGRTKNEREVNKIGDVTESSTPNLGYVFDNERIESDHRHSNAYDVVDGETYADTKPVKLTLSYTYEDGALHDDASIGESEYFQLEKLTETEIEDDDDSESENIEDEGYCEVEKVNELNKEKEEGRKDIVPRVKRQLSFQVEKEHDRRGASKPDTDGDPEVYNRLDCTANITNNQENGDEGAYQHI